MDAVRRRWLGAGCLLLAAGGGLWAVGRIDVPPPPAPAPVVEPSETPTPMPVRVTIEPPSVPAGTARVRVTSFCEDDDTVVESNAFPESPDTYEKLPGRGWFTDADLDRALPAGRYPVIVRCGARFGRADLVVTKGRAPKPPGPPRVATTWVTLTRAQPGAWQDHPDAAQMPVIGRAPNAILCRMRVTHEVRVPVDDPDVAALRAGAAGRAPAEFVAARMGSVALDSPDLDVAFSTPVIRTERGSRGAVITYTGVSYTVLVDPNSFVGVEYRPSADATVSRLTAHEIVVSATGWTVAGVSGPPPLTQDAHYLRASGGSPMTAAFTMDGRSGPVAYYLGGDEGISQYLEGGAAESDESDESDDDETGAFLSRSWEVLRLVSSVAAMLALFYTLARALGGSWWRRPRNWLLMTVVAAGSGLMAFFLNSDVTNLTALVLMVVVPVLALFSTARAARGHSRLPAVVPAVAGIVAGLILCAWSLAALLGPGPATGGLAGAVAVTTVTAVLPRLRRLLPHVALLLTAAGALLAGRAVSIGFTPPNLMWMAMIALAWCVLVFGWVTEASHRWSPAGAARWVIATSVALGALAYSAIPVQDWASLRWGGLVELLSLVVLQGIPMLALIMLVVRVRRWGQGPEGLTETAAFHTALLFVLLMHLQFNGSPVTGLVVLLTWAGVCFMLPAPREGLQRAVSGEEHRLLVRDMIRRRSARTALTHLLRQPGDDFEQRREALEQAGDERNGPVDSDLALATVAGRTPWQNGLAAFGAGAVLSLPYSAVRISESVRGGQAEPSEVLYAALALLSLPVLCMVFGYFYPRVRGRGPIAKSLSFLLAALLVELPVSIYGLVLATTYGINGSEPLVGVLVAVGNIAVVSIGLGLWWEWRLMWLAGEPWARVRNVRTLRALAAPLAAVSIAIATAAATALVNNVVAPLPSAPVVDAKLVQTPTPAP
ncbi:hypothetical protein [Nonomuraea insulae]|uniref:Uncharacterized protein n=1 Tax=Nonomuraea insulae TaxID=1616787 RepID=A0ABW1CTP0_9ACTN